MEMEAKTGQPLPAAHAGRAAGRVPPPLSGSRPSSSRKKKRPPSAAWSRCRSGLRKDYPLFADTPWNFLKVASTSRSRVSAHPRQTYHPRRERLPRMLGDRPPADGACRWTRWNCSCTSRCTSFSGPRGTVRLALHGPMGLHPGQDDHRLPLDRRASTAQPGCRRLPVGLSHPAAPTARTTSGRSARSPPAPAPSGCQPSSRCWPFTSRGKATPSAYSKRRRPAEIFWLPERAGLSPGLSAASNIYHPHEASADLFAKLVLFDGYLSARMDSADWAAKEKSFGPLRAWFRKNLEELASLECGAGTVGQRAQLGRHGRRRFCLPRSGSSFSTAAHLRRSPAMLEL